MKKLYRHPKWVIAIVLIITAFFTYQLKNLKIENNLRAYLPQDDPSYVRLLDTENQFGSMIITGISLETDQESIFNKEDLDVIKKVTSDLEKNCRHVEDVQSLSNIDFIEGVDGALVAGSLMPDDWSASDEQVQDVKKRLADWSEIYNRVVISDDCRATQIQVTMAQGATAEEKQEMLSDIRSIVAADTEDSNLTARIYGDTVIDEKAKEYVVKDLRFLIPLVILVVMLTLVLSFNNFEGMFLPLLSVLISTIWSVGFMAWIGESFSIVSSIIPVALIAVGSAYGIHVMTHYYAHFDTHQGAFTRESYIDFISEAVGEVKVAVILAGVTTIVGFISLMTSPIQPLHSFAVFTAMGVAIALILSITLIPCVLALKPLSKVGKKSKFYERRLKRMQAKQEAGFNPNKNGAFLYTVYHNLTGSKARLILFLAAILIVSGIGLDRLVVDTAIVNYFPRNGEVRRDIAFADDNFAGTNSVFFVIDGDDATDVELLKGMDDLQAMLYKKYPHDIGKIVSFSTFVKRMNQVMHIPEPALAAEPVEDTGFDTEGADFGFDDSATGFDTDASFGFDEGSDMSFDSGDSFGFDDDSASLDFASDMFDGMSFDAAAPAAESAATDEYVDPNIEYSKQLAETRTTEEMLQLMHNAYVNAGGSNATVEGMVDELAREFNYDGMAYYEIPYDPAKYPLPTREELSQIVSQYLILFSGSLDQFNNDPLEPTKTRMTVILRTHSTDVTRNIIDDAQAFAKKRFPSDCTFEATGTGEMELHMTDMVVSSQLKSLLFSLVSVIVILSVAFRSLGAGLLGAIPLALTILINYMVMGFTGINLDLATSIIASVAIGVGIDYTIHFMETYRNECVTQGEKLDQVTRETFRKSGMGIVTNAMAVGLGFLVLCLSQFIVLRYIGILVAIVMFSSSFLALTVIPGFLNVTKPKFIRKEKSLDMLKKQLSKNNGKENDSKEK